MPGCHAAIVTRCDSRADFGTCPYCGYSAVGEPFGACPCSGYNAVEGSLSAPASAARSEEIYILFHNCSPNPAANPRTSSIPIIFFSFVNQRRSSSLVRMSVSCQLVLTNPMTIYPPSTQSLRK